SSLPLVMKVRARWQENKLPAIARGKRKGRQNVRPSLNSFARLLDRANVLRLPALRALHNVELNLLAFLQRAKTVALDGAVMHENIFTAGAAQKAKALRVVKPL